MDSTCPKTLANPRSPEQSGQARGGYAIVPATRGGGRCRRAIQSRSAYDNGKGVAEDKAEAVKWYRRAAEQEDPRAIQLLASHITTARELPRTRRKRSNGIAAPPSRKTSRSATRSRLRICQRRGSCRRIRRKRSNGIAAPPSKENAYAQFFLGYRILQWRGGCRG